MTQTADPEKGKSHKDKQGLDPFQRKAIDAMAAEPARLWTFGELAEKVGLSKKTIKDALMPMRSRAMRMLPTVRPDSRYDLLPNEVWLPNDSPLRPAKSAQPQQQPQQAQKQQEIRR